jgi:CMP-N-acetylneuraminic acid synthetase
VTLVGLIPARGGSKRVPGKNLTLCAGKPLLAWTAEAALASRRLDRVVLSTDDDAIAEAGKRLGLEVPFLRPPALSGDKVPMAPVMRHALDWLIGQGERVEALVLLQPSSPLRQAHHIDEAAALFLESDAETLVSIVAVPHIFHPAKLQRIEGGRLVPYGDGQEDPSEDYYGRNGPALLINRPEVIARGERFGRSIVPYVMAPEDSVDIDEPFDLTLAEALLLRRQSADRRRVAS